MGEREFHEWGPGHPLWESRVLGNFPKQSQDALISLTWLEQAKQRELRADQQQCLLTAGIDDAGPGEDETVLAIRQGNNIIEIRSFRQQDARGELVAALLPYQARLGFVNVDAAGIGWYMAQHPAEYFRVQAINVEGFTDSERFVNLKAELYWGVRMDSESGCRGSRMRRRSHSWLRSATSTMRAGKSSLNRKKKRAARVEAPIKPKR